MRASDPVKDTRGPIYLFLALLLAADAAFAVIHIVHFATPYLPSTLYSIEADGGFGEWFQYTKELWAIIMIAVLWKRTARPWAIGWLLMFMYFLLDDAVSVHELGGDIVYRHLGFGPALGLRAQDLGELFVIGIVGVSLLAILAYLYRRSNDDERTVSRDLLLLSVVLVIFGVGLDMLHSMIDVMAVRYVMGMVEDGGEMVTMSVTCWYLMTVVDRNGLAPVPSLVDRARSLVSRK